MAVRIRIDHEDPNWRRSELLELQKVAYMDPALYKAAKEEGNYEKVNEAVQQISEAKQPSLHPILNQVSPAGNSLLHVAASYGRKEITQLVAREFPFLIIRPNYQGDTPLHVAVKAGKLETTETLVNCAKDCPDVGSLLRITNRKGNTALHEAVMICKPEVQIVQFLATADPDAAYLANKEDKSPLYLAAELTTDSKACSAKRQCKSPPPLDPAVAEKILSTLLQAIKEDEDSPRKLKGKSPMHAAFETENSMHAAIEFENLDMLKVIVNSKPELMYYKDEKERTPLHYAASNGSVDGVHYLLEKFRDAMLAKDKDGLYPIHLACENGHVDVIKALLEKWPDATEWLSNKGQNILHVAAANGNVKVVKFLIRTPPSGLDVYKLVNEKDDDGNTPLHLATYRGQSLAVWSLARDKRFPDLLSLKNNQGYTAYNIAEKQSQRDDSDDSKRPVCLCGKDQMIVDEENLKAIVVTAEKKSTIDRKSSKEPDLYGTMMTLSVIHVLQLAAGGCKSISKNLNVKSKLPSKDELTQRINTIMVVAALVAGVTFSAAVQTPTRREDSDKDPTTIKARDILFQLFFLFDTVAMNFSIMAAIIVSWAYLGDINLGSLAVWAASGVLWYSLYMMVFAFLAAAVIAVVKDIIILWIVVIFEIMFVAAHTIFSIPMIIPIRFKHVFIPYIYFLIFCLYYVYKWFAKFNDGKKGKKDKKQNAGM